MHCNLRLCIPPEAEFLAVMQMPHDTLLLQATPPPDQQHQPQTSQLQQTGSAPSEPPLVAQAPRQLHGQSRPSTSTLSGPAVTAGVECRQTIVPMPTAAAVLKQSQLSEQQLCDKQLQLARATQSDRLHAMKRGRDEVKANEAAAAVTTAAGAQQKKSRHIAASCKAEAGASGGGNSNPDDHEDAPSNSRGCIGSTAVHGNVAAAEHASKQTGSSSDAKTVGGATCNRADAGQQVGKCIADCNSVTKKKTKKQTSQSRHLPCKKHQLPSVRQRVLALVMEKQQKKAKVAPIVARPALLAAISSDARSYVKRQQIQHAPLPFGFQ